MKSPEKILFFIAARNCGSTIEAVLASLPTAIGDHGCETLVIDDDSIDGTFSRTANYRSRHPELHLTVLSNPEALGYGGTQKLGFHYAIEKDFSVVALLHGDSPATADSLGKMILPVLNDEADAVFAATKPSSFKPTGWRVYAVKTLKQIPFALNTDGSHFNKEIAIQLGLNESRIRKIPIPMVGSGEGWRANGLASAWNALKSSRRAHFHRLNISFHRQFDIVKPGRHYPPKFDYLSSHTMAINEVSAGACVLDIGSGAGHVGRELEKRGCQVTGVDMATEAEEQLLQRFAQIDLNRDPLPYRADGFDFILLLDVLEHLDQTAQSRLLEEIRAGSKSRKPALIITLPNIAFLLIRLQLLLGKFNYGKRGILDISHRHFFTFKSARRFLKQAGYKIEKEKGIPLPFPQIIGNNMISGFLLRVNAGLIWFLPGIFSYQIFIKATPLPTEGQLLQLASEKAKEKESDLKG
ncbi:MAG: methyltransferase domain-containing protein [Candidatus Aminicenantes bacterium]|nr:methyltransferase domain-containing protein [Candidatus Aminicenantes bacterium]